MATAQKRGFRFPWGSDGHRDQPPTPAESPAAHEDEDETNLAARLGAIADDLGRGPFDLAAPVPEPEPEPTDPEPEPEPASQPEPEAVADSSIDAVAAEPPVSDAVAPADAAAAAVAAPTLVADVPPEPEAGATWPDIDRRSTAPAQPAVSPAPPSPARRDNPLVAGLVRAMREAARTARDEAVTSLHRDARTREEAIRTRSGAAVAELRKVADSDVVAIREWLKAELARVREEAEGRIVARRMRLLAENEAEAANAEELVKRLGEAVGAYEAETASFFEALLAEGDPARLAGLAERLPPPPPLDAFPLGDTAGTVPTRAARAGAAASTKTTAKVTKHPSRRGTARPASRPSAVEPVEPAVPTQADEAVPAVESVESVESSVADELGGAEVSAPADPSADFVPAPVAAPGVPEWLDPDAAAAAEAASLVGLDRHTNLIVSGLTSVGAIAGFKAELMHVAGITAINVAAGDNGDFLFTVTHEAETDLRDAMRSMGSFETRLIADDGDTLVVVAREPAA